MSISLLIILISVVSAVGIIIPSWSVIIDNYEKGWRKIRLKGWILLIAVLMLAILPTIQYHYQQKEEKLRDEKLRKSYDSSLLEIKKKFDSTSYKTDSIISDNLGKYGYKFDSAANTLGKLIRDSTQLNTLDYPILQIMSKDFKHGVRLVGSFGGELLFKLELVSSYAGSTSFEITCSIVLQDTSGRFIYSNKIRPIQYGEKLSVNYSHQFNFIIPNPKIQVRAIYFWTRGKYKDLLKTKSFYMDLCHYYIPASQTFGMTDDLKTIIIKEEVFQGEKK